MSERKHNFNAGPAALPLSVLETVQRNLVDFDGQGLSLLEMSHRTREFEAVLERARGAVAALYDLPETHEVLFLQGGASLQFAMVPLNLGAGGAYIDTGRWSAKALSEAQAIGPAQAIWSHKDEGYRAVPQPDTELVVPEDAPYVHYTSNNTIAGTQFHHVPDVNPPLVADMSSDFLSRPIDVRPFDLIYAGAQKNAGPAGVTIVIARKEISRGYRGAESTPKILRYVTQAEKDSMYNTPNTFGIWVVALVAEWVQAQGGLAAMAKRNAAKAEKLYAALDGRADLYTGRAEAASRSHMNVAWNMPTPQQEQAFLKAAAERGMIGLKGHRSMGGLRASIYNAVPEASVDALVELLGSFSY